MSETSEKPKWCERHQSTRCPCFLPPANTNAGPFSTPDVYDSDDTRIAWLPFSEMREKLKVGDLVILNNRIGSWACGLVTQIASKRIWIDDNLGPYFDETILHIARIPKPE